MTDATDLDLQLILQWILTTRMEQAWYDENANNPGTSIAPCISRVETTEGYI